MVNCVPTSAAVLTPHPARPFTVKRCLRNMLGEQPRVKHVSGGHDTIAEVRSNGVLVPALPPSGSKAVAPGSHGLSAEGDVPLGHGR